MDEPMPVEGASLTPSTSDNFTDAEHKKKDEEVTQAASKFLAGLQDSEWSELHDAFLLQCIIKHSEGKLQVAFMDNEKAIKLMRANPKLGSVLKKAWRAKDYKEIRKSELLTVPKPNKDQPGEQQKATENAWTTQYRGEAPEALWIRIKKAMNQPGRYARYLAIVQSSGTGKSRMIEELSKKHLVIPVNLRGSLDTGYPPPDKIPRAYISGTTTREDARVHAVAFLKAVFKEASKLITKLRKEDNRHTEIPGLFSEYMSEGMTYNSHGDKRRSFYDKVDLSARMLEGETKEAFAKKSGSSFEDQLASAGICEVFNELIVSLSPVRTIAAAASGRGAAGSRHRQAQDPEPLVVLAFDEARTLAKPDNDEPWSHFSELRRALRALNNQPLFSLFLTTTGNVNTLVPSSRKDLSSRMPSQVFSASRPFAEIGFDQFALKNQFDLRVVADDEHISHFGRPLWATRYDEGNYTVKDRIIQFAALKLRAGRNWPGDALDNTEKLACLAQRLPIEFHSVTYASKEIELKLVEGHMRILLRVDAGFESLTTVSASEPLLSEAAYWMMNTDTTFNAAEMLKSCLDGYAIHKGDRGELLVMLLFILARDRAIGHPDDYGRPVSRRRWCSVPNFMNALFKFKRDPLQGLFTQSKIFFNHWVKVHQYAIVNIEYLAQLMRRGAALLCATNQAAFDGIVPFLIEGYTIFPKNIGALIWQGKNDQKFKDEPDPSLFTAMDPHKLGIPDDIPIIRVVFALASKTPCLKLVPRKNCDFKGCDLWVGGISPTIFPPVGDHDASIWAALLQATYGWEDMYKKNFDGRTDNMEEGLRRSMNPGTAKDGRHWDWADFKAMSKIKENKKDENEEDVNMDED